MPGGDGTGPMWAGARAGWGGRGWWCRGGYGGYGGRAGYRAAHPGWGWRLRAADPPHSVTLDTDDERRELEVEADLLETELRQIKTRIEQLRKNSVSDS